MVYRAAGLSYETQFDLKQALDLPYTTEWFSVPPAAPHGQTPKLGTLHPSLVRTVQARFMRRPGELVPDLVIDDGAGEFKISA